MKRNAVILAVCALMLTGCSEDKQTEEIIRNSITEGYAETTLVTSEKSAETTIVTELAVQKEPFRVIDADNDFMRLFVLDDGIVCSPSSNLKFIDTETGEIIASVPVAEDFGFERVSNVMNGSGDVFAKAVCGEYDYSVTPPAYSADVMIIDNNYECEILRDCEAMDVAFEACGHSIAEWSRDIVDTDSGEIIVPGYTQEGDEYGFYTKWNMYCFDIDDNRFVYRVGGYEQLPGFGIYDFSTGTATEVPASSDLIPIGYHDGKVYSVKTAWDGYGTELYTTNVETLQTEFFMEYPYEHEPNQFIDYSMDKSGDFIIIFKQFYANEGVVDSACLFKVNPDTAEVEAEIEIPEEYALRNTGYIVDENTFAVQVEDSVLLIDISE